MNTTNKNITLRGAKLTVIGKELRIGDALPAFKVVANDMSDLTNDAFKGAPLVVLSLGSVDTQVCSDETRRFNSEVAALPGVKVLAVSMDLPFAQMRWCAASGVSSVRTASDYKYRTFGESFGTYVKESGLLARAVFIADSAGKIVHVEYVPEIVQEPDYEAALTKVRELVAAA